MYNILRFKKITLNTIYSLLIILIISLFISFKKIIYLPIIFLILFFFVNESNKRIILINLLILCFLLKSLLSYFIGNDKHALNFIYEKNFLYGVKNFEKKIEINSGDLNKILNKKVYSKYIQIKNDNLGFRNNTNFKNQDYILLGDSFIHNLNIDNKDLLNSILKKNYDVSTYNASITAQDISHYLETIKFFKNLNTTSKYVMFIYTGNDFLDYKKNSNKKYNQFINNKITNLYFEIKKFFNFFSYLSFYKNLFLKKEANQNKVIEFNNNNQTMLFYKDYINRNNIKLNFSDEFNIYKDYQPDYLIIIPTKAEIYCYMFEEIECKKINYKSYFENINIFNKTKIFDSTNFLKSHAKKLLYSNNKIIFDYDDTHLNEEGLSLLADFFYHKIIN
jgi:hypothetical protein